MGEEERTITVPVVYVDAAEVHAFPYTDQVILGAVTPGGSVPRVQLAMAPAFAMELVESLQRALGDYRGPGAPERGDATP